jgi:hypothetical protein
VLEVLDVGVRPNARVGRAARAAPGRPGRRLGADSADDPTRWLTAHVARQYESSRNNALSWATHRATEWR